MSETEKPSLDQFEQTFKENPRLIQFLTEQQRYKQQARLRALDLAFQRKPATYIKDSFVDAANTPDEHDYLADAETYYNWLIDILPDQLF